MTLGFAAGAALVLGVVCQPFVIRFMASRGAVDVPNERSSHRAVTPRGGGVAVVLAGCAGLALVRGNALVPCLAMLAAGLLGLAEDLRGVPVRARLAAQLLTGAVVGTLLAAAGRLPVAAGVAAVTAVAVWLTGYVNAFNFMDGLNGIAGAHATVAGGTLAAVGLLVHDTALAGAGLVIAAASLSFLPWNAGTARIFLGDVGSYGLGGALAAVTAAAVLRGVPTEAAVAPLAVGLADTGWTLMRRIRAGECWYQAHRTHVYQRLTDAGGTHSQVAFGTAALAALLGLLGLVSLGSSLPARVAADAAGVLLLAGYLGLPGRLGQRAALRAAS